MRTFSLLMICIIIFYGCGKDETRRPRRVPLAIDALAIRVRDGGRDYVQSDKKGGFLVGTVGSRMADADRWSVDGKDVLESLTVETVQGPLTADRLDSAQVLPYETRKYYAGGTLVRISVLEGLEGLDTHGLAVRVSSASAGTISLKVVSSAGSSGGSPDVSGHSFVWTTGNGGTVVLSAGEKGKASAWSAAVEASGEAAFVIVALGDGTEPGAVAMIVERVESLLVARRSRMEDLLNASFIRTSDDTLNKAVHWIKLSLDALQINHRDTFAVAAVPWDGAFDLRANAQSIAGLGLATGDYRRTSAIIRSLVRYQDEDTKSSTYGRLADRVSKGHATYAGADVAPWFVRELYEHVVYSNDTTLVRVMYPAIKRSLEGTIRNHTDRYNFLTHGSRETWMSSTARGNRAVEIQLLWYFQQLIGSYVATYLGDTTNARAWWESSVRTSDNFAEQFADTSTKMLADYLTPEGSKDLSLRPNAVMCLEMLEREPMRFGVTRATVKNLTYPYGVTMSTEPSMASGPTHGGPAWTWLAGPVTYALTRYDRQDLSYLLTKTMARVALTEDMAGTLPEILTPGPEGGRASLTGMAEFVRSLYQDYLGLRVDLAAKTLTIQPKLPDELTNVEFTVYAGSHPIHGIYARVKEEGRIFLDAPSLPSQIKVTFLWMMNTGDAWRGSARLQAGVPFTLVMGKDDVLLFQGDEKVELDTKRQLRNFSQRKSAAEFSLAGQ